MPSKSSAPDIGCSTELLFQTDIFNPSQLVLLLVLVLPVLLVLRLRRLRLRLRLLRRRRVTNLQNSNRRLVLYRRV
jgi:hypothetical protein